MTWNPLALATALHIKKSEDDAVVIGRDLQRTTGRVLHCFRGVIA